MPLVIRRESTSPVAPVAQNLQEVVQLYRATATATPLNGAPSLFMLGDTVAMKVEFVAGSALPVETYWNLTSDPNVQIPNGFFDTSLMSGLLIEVGNPTEKVKKSLLATYVLITETPQTISELIAATGTTIPSDTKHVTLVIDNITAMQGDSARFATFASVIDEGQDFLQTEFDTAEQITDNKFVVVSPTVGRTIKMYIECFNTKN